MKRKLVIWGASGHALVVADIISLMDGYELTGFIDDVNTVESNTSFRGVTVYRDRACLEDLKRHGLSHLIFGFGNCDARLSLAEWAYDQGFLLATAVHPKAIIAADVVLGAGTVVAAGAVINPGATIGRNVIINTCASVDHECEIDDGAHICPGSHLAGSVTVGRASWVGIGTSVVEKCRIGAGVKIGAGSVVVNDIPDGVLAYGVPAKVIKRL